MTVDWGLGCGAQRKRIGNSRSSESGCTNWLGPDVLSWWGKRRGRRSHACQHDRTLVSDRVVPSPLVNPVLAPTLLGDFMPSAVPRARQRAPEGTGRPEALRPGQATLALDSPIRQLIIFRNL